MIQLIVEVKKMNAKLFNQVVTEPFDVQELENDVTVELHSLNQNEALFNEYAPKAKFAVWTCADGKHYRLLLEDGYYVEMRELYGKRVNQSWVNFWDEVEKGRGIFSDKLGENGQLIAMAAVLVVFVIANMIINKKIDKIINTSNSNAIEKIKNIVGHKRFDELMEGQRIYYDKFFGIEEEENLEPTEEVLEEAPQEETNNE